MAGVLYIDTSFNKITVKPVHPTFGAEIQVPDWNNLDDDAVREIISAANKVGRRAPQTPPRSSVFFFFYFLHLLLTQDPFLQYGFCIFRNTGLDDKGHVEFSQRLGELDNIKRFLTGGRKPRYEHLELFDAGNIADDGSLLDPESTRAHNNRVSRLRWGLRRGRLPLRRPAQYNLTLFFP